MQNNSELSKLQNSIGIGQRDGEIIIYYFESNKVQIGLNVLLQISGEVYAFLLSAKQGSVFLVKEDIFKIIKISLSGIVTEYMIEKNDFCSSMENLANLFMDEESGDLYFACDSGGVRMV